MDFVLTALRNLRMSSPSREPGGHQAVLHWAAHPRSGVAGYMAAVRRDRGVEAVPCACSVLGGQGPGEVQPQVATCCPGASFTVTTLSTHQAALRVGHPLVKIYHAF